jgi:DNA-binding NarL/FixJ family response regulator
MTISVVLVDDHVIFRESVRALLNATTDFQIVGEAGDGKAAMTLSEHLHPDVVVLDCIMPQPNGMEVALWLHQHQPATHVVMLSMHKEEDYVLRSIQNCASGYILKEDIVAHLARAINSAAASQSYFSPSLKENIDLSAIGF